MALLGSSSSSSSNMGLTPSYINNLIRETMNAQRQPIYTLTAQKDQLNVKKGVYADLKNSLMTLRLICYRLTAFGKGSDMDDLVERLDHAPDRRLRIIPFGASVPLGIVGAILWFNFFA